MKNQTNMKQFFITLFAILLSASTFAQDVITYYHTDMTGSPLAATDASGNVVWREDFSPYGERLLKQSAANGNHLWFTSHHHDEQSGLTYAGARHYDPMIGRFMGVDPAGTDPENQFSFSRYAYGNNNPYRYVDPDGHSPVDVAFLAYDLGKLSVALWTGTGVAAAAMDVAWSTVGVVSPVPGTGQVIKAARAVDHSIDIVRTADNAVDAAQAAKIGEKASDAARGGADLVDDAARGIPTGSLRSPMKVPGPQNVPTTVGGRQYTGHALDQMQGRGFTPSVVEDTLARGVRTSGRDGASVFTTDQARVIVNPNGSIKTVYGQ